MKELINKTTTIENEKKGEEIIYTTYGDLISFICSYSDRTTTIPLNEQRIRFKIMDAVEASNGSINLDENWLPTLKILIDKHPFGMVHRDLVTFADDIDNLINSK